MSCLDLIPIRPHPDGMLYVQTADAAGVTTGITYVWARDPRGLCRRCPPELCRPLVCNGTVICSIQVADDIPREDAPTFDLGAWLAKEGGSREGA